PAADADPGGAHLPAHRVLEVARPDVAERHRGLLPHPARVLPALRAAALGAEPGGAPGRDLGDAGGGGGAGHAGLGAGVSLPRAGGGGGVPPDAGVPPQPPAVRIHHDREPDAVHLPRRRAALARSPQRMALLIAVSAAPAGHSLPGWSVVDPRDRLDK